MWNWIRGAFITLRWFFGMFFRGKRKW